jgi:transposase
MAKAKTPSFILELGLEVNAHEEAELNKRFEAARQLYNACLDEAKQRLELLRQSKEYQEARSMPRTENGKQNSKRTEAFKALNTRFGFTEFSFHAYSAEIRQSWIGNHIDSATAQKLATRAFKAVQRIAFGKAFKVRFKGRVPCAHQCGNEAQIPDGRVQRTQQGKNQLSSVEGKSNDSGIRYKETGYVEWNGLKLLCIIDVSDKVVVHGLSCRVKYCRIIKRIFNGKARFFVQLVLEGKPFIKEKNEAPDNIVGLDIGPSTIAYVSKEHASLERFCDELEDKQTFRRLQRKLDRQRRANNPQNYNPNGTIKPGKKTWHESTRYKKTRRKLAELQQKFAAHRKSLHGNLANRILKQGKHIKTEKLSYKAFQRKFGKSVQNRAPGMFVETLLRKAENAGGEVDEFSTKTTRLSQYCHKCGKYTKKPLSQRWHTCCGLNIQRDLYSAFLATSVVENKLDTADVINNPHADQLKLLSSLKDLDNLRNAK